MKTAQEYLPTKFWIMKSEPDVFSFQDLVKRKTEFWDGVRNYQARNFMMKNMKLGDKVLFYHSNATPPGVAGVCEIVEEAKPDLSSLNPKSDFYDEKATAENPRWYAVTVGKPVTLKKFVSLTDMKENINLKDMLLVRKGQRLSILPLSKNEFELILQMGNSIK